MRRKVIPDHLAVLHHKSNSLDLGDIGDRVSSNGNKISKFAGLDRADAVLPAQHLCRIDGDRTNNVERRHSGSTQVNEGRGACFAARLSRIEPAHIRSSRKFHPRLQNSRNQFVVLLLDACIRAGIGGVEGGRHHYAWLSDLHEKVAIPSGRQIPPPPPPPPPP